MIWNRFFLILMIGLVSVQAKTQAELWKQIQVAESENRIDDALELLLQAKDMNGPYNEDILISLAAYAEVLGRDDLMPVQMKDKSAIQQDIELDLSSSFTLGGYGGSYSQQVDSGTYAEIFTGTTASLGFDWVWGRGNLVHTISVGSSFDEYIPVSSSGPGAVDSSLAASYTIVPSLGYSLLWDRFLLSVSGDYLMIQDEDPSFAANLLLSYTLMRMGSMRWAISGSAYQSLAYTDKYTVKTTISRRESAGVLANLSAAYVIGVDTLNKQTVAPFYTLYATNGGPDFGAKLGWTAESWWFETNAGFGMFTCFQADRWEADNAGVMDQYTWRKQYTRFRLGATLGLNLTDDFGTNLGVNYQVKKYANMPETHPEYYMVHTSSFAVDLGLSYSF